METPSTAPQIFHTEFRHFFHLPTHLFCVFGQDGTFRQTNIAQKHILGWDPEELIGKPVDGFVHSDDVARTFEEMGKLFQQPGHVVSDFRNRCTHRDGGFRWISWSGTCIEGAIYCIGMDVTSQIEAETAKQRVETRFRALFEQSPVSLQIFSVDGDCVYANDAWERLYETSRKELEGFNLFTDPQLRALGIVPLIQRAIQGEPIHFPPHPFDPAKSGRAGKPRWLEVYMFPIKDKSGRVQELAHISLDVTSIIEAQNKLRDSEEWLRLAMGSGNIGTWDHHPKTGLLNWNPRCRELFGVSPDVVASYELFIQAIHPEDRERALKASEAAHSGKTNGAYSATFRILGIEDRKTRWVFAQGRVYFDAAGQVDRAVGTMTDISEQKDAEEQLRLAVKARDEFLSIASHELRTPMTVVLLQVQMMRRGLERGDPEVFSSQRMARFMEKTERNVERLGRLVEEMLDVSRIQSGRLQIRPESCDVTQLVKQVVDHHFAGLCGAGIQVTVVADDPVTVVVDPLRMEQVLTNLMTNAIRYAPNGPLRIEIQADARSMKILVTDGGPGVAKEDQERIFKQYERLVSANEVSGLGLGLYISREIVQAHGGTIEVRGEPGQGATFVIEIPS